MERNDQGGYARSAAPPSAPTRPSSLSSSSSFEAVLQASCVKSQVSPDPKYLDFTSSSSSALVPASCDLVLSIYRELLQLVNRLPFQKKLVVCIVYRGNKIRLDLGQVRSAGVACLIGLGLSLGTLLLYKIYFRIVVPFLESIRASRGSNSWLDDVYTLHLDSSEPSESEVDTSMGNSNSKKPTPSVYYAPKYGVSLGSRPPSLNLNLNDDTDTLISQDLRMRDRKQSRPKSPSPVSDKDSAIGGVGGSEMSQSLYSDISVFRDSFYSSCTAESGFDDMGFLDELRTAKLSGSLKENFSPSSLREKNMQMLYRAHHGRDPGLNNVGRSMKPNLDTLSDCSSERSGIVSSRSHRSSCGSECTPVFRTNVDPLCEKYSCLTSSSNTTCSRQSYSSCDNHSSGLSRTSESGASAMWGDRALFGAKQHSFHRSPRHPGHNSMRMHGPHLTPRPPEWTYGDPQPPVDYDPSLDTSESIRSFTSSMDGLPWGEGGESLEQDRRQSLPLHLNTSLSDIQFKQNLMQRIQEWSSFAQEYTKSRSPTPGCSPIRFVRRSRSLDRHISDPSVLATDSEIPASKPIEIEPVTEKNLESLEYELHDIQGEFESITSKLHELIEHRPHPTDSADPAKSASRLQPPSAKRAAHSASNTPTHSHRSESTPRLYDSKQLMRRMRTKWERVPSSGCSDSSRSSRASSVEFVWDLADYTHSATADRSKLEEGLGPGGTPLPSTQVGKESDASNDHTRAAESMSNMSLPVDIGHYADQEWKGNTHTALTIKEGYHTIPNLIGCHRLCITRGDNYCALRSALFQVLVKGVRATQHWTGIIGIMDSLHDLFNNHSVGLHRWTFANRLPGHCRDKLASLSKCALSLYATIEEVHNLPTREQREKRTISLFNSSATFDRELMEGMKVMMLLSLVELESRIRDLEEVPVFGHLLFARDTSETVADFLVNHLNPVGDTGGLEQVEMCLLGYTLGVRIRVFRLSQHGQQDFDCFFPEDIAQDCQNIELLAEDDRHYNVPLP